jgi:hypothetical protein
MRKADSCWLHPVKDEIPVPNAELLPLNTGAFMVIAGIAEIAAGVLVLPRPVIGAYVGMDWVIASGRILILGGKYFDVAVQDLAMAVGALVFAKLPEFLTIKGAFNEKAYRKSVED